MITRISIRMTLAVLLSHGLVASASEASSLDNAFNPAFSLILSGTYAALPHAPAGPATGFAMHPNVRNEHGFNLGESEMGISANIDPQFRGAATLAIDPAGGVSVENAFVQTTALGDGMNLKFGRFFSGLGYLNEVHAHAWDFVDQPLVYATFWGNQLGEDGVQFKWLAPTDTFIEIGGEMGKGRGFPGTDTPRNGVGGRTLFVHVGDDIGIEHSWRVGASMHLTTRVDATSTDVPDMHSGLVSNSFSGDSQTYGMDLVWKYSPNSNVRDSYVKVQSEYFLRRENGNLTYDTLGTPITDTFSVTQSGFYIQSVYQFMPRWRVAARYDHLDPGVAKVGVLNAGNVISDYAFKPTRASLMLDYSPSEFSRLRMQLARDDSIATIRDYQFLLQYVMSLGAHGAHSY
jgi:hypothetical protein